ncbi:MAG: hypothetical protein AB1480_09765 [Nitrospirota bacterium]
MEAKRGTCWRKEMNALTIRAGAIKPDSFSEWLASDSFKKWGNGTGNIYALLEYMHRFNLVDWNGVLEEIKKGEIADYSLRGRIFWENGQIEWRKMDKETYNILILEEGGATINLLGGYIPTKEVPPLIEVWEDTTIVLWGTYNPHIGGFLEKRVSGSQPVPYPSAFKTGKKYPVMWIRIYKDSEGEPQLWRFVKPDAMNPEDWKEEKEVKDAKS